MKSLIPSLLLISSTFLNTTQADDTEDLFDLSLEELMRVEVSTAGKIAEKLGEIPASVVLITRRDIQRYGYSSLEDILQHVSGIYHIHFYDLTGPALGVRGYLSTSSANRNVIILINGINQVSDYDASYYFPHTPVPVEAIDRIEIVRGPQSTIYGSGAFFGVINIITNEISQEEGNTNYVSASVGSQHSKRGFARTSYAFEKGNLVVNAGTYQEDGLDIPYSQLESEVMAGESGLSTGGRLENAEKYFDFSANYQNFSLNITHVQSDTEGFLSRPTVRTGTVRKVESTHLRVGYKKAFSQQLSLDSKLTYIHVPIHIDYDSFLMDDLWSVQEYNTTAYEGEVTLWWQSSAHFDLTSGLYYRYVPKISTYIDVPSLPQVASLQGATQRLQDGEAFINRALFFQLSYRPDTRWKWVAGLRLEQTLGYEAFSEYGKNPEEYQSLTVNYDDQDVAIVPRLAAIYTPNEKHIFKWMYGKAINAPSFSQNVIEPDVPVLESEQIETFEFDYLTYLSPNYLLSANLFHSRLENLFQRVTIGDHGTFLGNAGSWLTNGIELSLQAQPTPKTEFELSMTYQQTKDRQHPEIEVGYSPHLLSQFKFNYQWTPRLNLGFTAHYVSKMEVFFDETLENSDGSFGGYISDISGEDYVLAGANVRFQDWLASGTFINFHINNLFDKEIIYPTYTRNDWMDRGVIGEGRNFILTVGYEF